MSLEINILEKKGFFMTPVELLLHPTYDQLVQNGKIERAIELAKNALEATANDTDLNVFKRAVEMSQGWFQLALLHELNEDSDSACKAAVEAFRHDVWNFEQHPYLVKFILRAKTDEMDLLAAKIANLHEYSFMVKEAHQNEDAVAEIRQMLEAEKIRSKEIGWQIEDFELTDDVAAFFNDEMPIENLLDRVERWRSEGRDPHECDKARTVFLDFAERYDEVVELWKDRDMSVIPDPTIFARALFDFVRTKTPFPEDLKAPMSERDPEDFVEATTEVLDYINELLDDPDLDEDEQDDMVDQLKDLGVLLCEAGLDLYRRFFDGEVNGYAASASAFSRLCFHYGGILMSQGQLRKAFDTLLFGMNGSPWPEIGFRLIDYGIKLEEADEVKHAVKWLENTFGDVLDIEDRQRLISYKLLILSRFGEHEDFFEEYRAFFEQYPKVANHRSYQIDPEILFLLPFELRPVVNYTLSAIDRIALAAANLLVNFSEDKRALETFFHATRMRDFPLSPEAADIINDEGVRSEYIDNHVEAIEEKRKQGIEVEEETREFINLICSIAIRVTLESNFCTIDRSIAPITYFSKEALATTDFREDFDSAKLSSGCDMLREAISYMSEFVKLEPIHAECYYLLGRALYSTDDESLEEAYDLFTTIIDKYGPFEEYKEEELEEIDVSSPDFDASNTPDLLGAHAYCMRARTGERLGKDPDSVISDYLRAFRINYAHFLAMRDMVEYIYENRKEIDISKYLEEFVLSAVQYTRWYNEPEHPEVVKMTLSVIDVLLEVGETERASVYVDFLEQHVPEHPEVVRRREMLEEF